MTYSKGDLLSVVIVGGLGTVLFSVTRDYPFWLAAVCSFSGAALGVLLGNLFGWAIAKWMRKP